MLKSIDTNLERMTFWKCFDTQYLFENYSLSVDYAAWEFEKRQLLRSRAHWLEQGNVSEAEKDLSRIQEKEER